jgi:signal transduction histidine kinase
LRDGIIEYFQPLQIEEADDPISFLVKNDEVVIGTNKNLIVQKLASINIENKKRNVNLVKALADDQELELNAVKVKSSFKVLHFLFSHNKNILFDKTDLFWNFNNQGWKKSIDANIISFSNLRPGIYNLKYKDNLTFGGHNEIQFCVLTPWWESWWVRSILALTLIPIMFYISKIQSSKKEKVLAKELELSNKIESERHRISRDLHDNIGAYTSALISNIRQLKNTLPSTDAKMEIIEENANHVLSSLRDTIWILNSNDHKVSELSSNFKNYCFKILKNYEEIEFHSEEEITNDWLLNGVETLHINRLLQESLNNSIKHGNPKNIFFHAESDHQKIKISIKDDGCGFKINEVEKGNGLNNILHRTKEVEGLTIINSIPDEGTSITFELYTHNRL